MIKKIFKYGWKAMGFNSYKEYLNSYFWKDKCALILKLQRDGNKMGINECERCHSRNHLNVHHKNYFNCCNEGLEDVIILCKSCHKKEHGTK